MVTGRHTRDRPRRRLDVRLSEDDRELLEHLANRREGSYSEVVRDGLHALAAVTPKGRLAGRRRRRRGR